MQQGKDCNVGSDAAKARESKTETELGQNAETAGLKLKGSTQQACTVEVRKGAEWLHCVSLHYPSSPVQPMKQQLVLFTWPFAWPPLLHACVCLPVLHVHSSRMYEPEQSAAVLHFVSPVMASPRFFLQPAGACVQVVYRRWRQHWLGDQWVQMPGTYPLTVACTTVIAKRLDCLRTARSRTTARFWPCPWCPPHKHIPELRAAAVELLDGISDEPACERREITNNSEQLLVHKQQVDRRHSSLWCKSSSNMLSRSRAHRVFG